MSENNLVKGSRVRVWRVAATLVSLAGMQMKTGAEVEDFVGTVTHIRGVARTVKEGQLGLFTHYEVTVKKDGTEEEVVVDPKHIVEIL